MTGSTGWARITPHIHWDVDNQFLETRSEEEL
jgi:hypothetical protein